MRTATGNDSQPADPLGRDPSARQEACRRVSPIRCVGASALTALTAFGAVLLDLRPPGRRQTLHARAIPADPVGLLLRIAGLGGRPDRLIILAVEEDSEGIRLARQLQAAGYEDVCLHRVSARGDQPAT